MGSVRLGYIDGFEAGHRPTQAGLADPDGGSAQHWPCPVYLGDDPKSQPFKTTSPAFTLEHFKTVRTDWEQMTASLHKRKGELHARDTTTC